MRVCFRADCNDARGLCVDVVEATALHHAVLKVDAYNACGQYFCDVFAQCVWLNSIAALKVERDRHVTSCGNAGGDLQEGLQRQGFAIGIALCGGHGPAAGCERGSTAFGNGCTAISVLAVIKHEGRAGLVQRGKGAGAISLGHGHVLLGIGVRFQ